MSESFENSIKEAFPNVPVPAALQERMRLREQAVTMGRRAEVTLKAAPSGDTRELMAQAILGRLAMMRDLPKGVSIGKLHHSLRSSPAFEKYTAQPLETQLEGLKSKSFLQVFAPAKTQTTSPKAATAPTAKPSQKGILP